MDDDCTLRAKAREALQNGKLPTRKPDRTLGGLGRGGACALCGEALTPTGMEIEMEFGRKRTTRRLDIYHLHPRCFVAWELVRGTLEADPGTPLPIDAVSTQPSWTDGRGAAEAAAD
jgi:hypothetical protein